MGHKTKRVAVIDDSEVILTAVTEALSDVGCEVVAVPEPSSSLLNESQQFDLVLMDINMPQSFGDDIARFLKEACGVTAPIYLFSSLSENELRQRAQSAGADGYFCKSWGMDRLVAGVVRILGLPVARGARSADPTAAGESQTIYEEFVARCEVRRAKILRCLDACSEDPGLSGEMIEGICVQIHDWMGEARLLDLDKLGAVVEALDDVLLSWGGRFIPSTHGVQVRAWINQLTDVSRRFALEPPDSALRSDLRALRLELGYELGSGEFVKEPTPVTHGEEHTPRRILVFDDSPLIGRALRTELEMRGHRVAIATNLPGFMEQLSEFQPQIIFLDVNMPDIKGDELCRQLRRRHDTMRVPIIFLSSLPDHKLSELSAKAGASGYLSKKHGMDNLARYLDEILSQILF